MERVEIKNYVAPFVGMSFFWVYLRYQSYFGLLYPLDSPTGTSPAFGVLLVVLLVLCAFSIAFRTRIEKIFLTQRYSVVLLSAMASGGAAMALAADSGLLGAWALWVSLPLVAAGFVAGYLGWATYFCYRFGPSDIVVLAASYLASLVFFTQWVPYLVAVFVPLGVGVSWFFAQPPRGSAVASKISSLKEVTPFIVLFIAFLLSGSILRGIVDSGSSDVGGLLFRWPLSVVVSAIVLFGCWISVRRMKERRMSLKSGEALWMQRAIDSMALKGWAALALMFFAAVFAGLIEGSYHLSGHIVVVARSMLDWLLWVVLCNLVSAKRLSPVLVFSACSILTNTVSWMLSYWLLPRLLTVEVGGRLPTSDVLVLLAAFALLALIILVFGVVASKRQAADALSLSTAEASLVRPCVSEEMAAAFKLTSREAEVASLFAQGHSMKKVASLLFISMSTAQSHIKSAYRKLDVHSKDELIDKLSEWQRESE